MQNWLIIIGTVLFSVLGIIVGAYFVLRYGSMKKREKRITKYTFN